MLFLGYDIGSSSVKASLLDIEKGETVCSAFAPENEMPIKAVNPGWAEQDPEMWYRYLVEVTRKLFSSGAIDKEKIEAIGIAYQMHGLVAVNRDLQPVRSSIIWCDSRAVEIGDRAFTAMGEDRSLTTLLNSPGNFTASKLKWVQVNEPKKYERIYKIMLPGDYMAMRLTGEIYTTVTGLSEGIFWDFNKNEVSDAVLDYFGYDPDLIPEIVPVFSHQGILLESVASELGLKPGIPVTYRAGDQPNNAFSLKVIHPGEIAATAGTSGVVYGISDEIKYDKQSRVNSFAHVNHTTETNRIGILLCINGTGILNSWVKQLFDSEEISYPVMNRLAAEAPIGSGGLTVLPFGNGAERMLTNRDPGSSIQHLNFNMHDRRHLMRAVQEGIVFSFRYGMEIMEQMGIQPRVIRAGYANMFQSEVFRKSLATSLHSNIELFNTDGSAGAARGAALGTGELSIEDIFTGLNRLEEVLPDEKNKQQYDDAYHRWKKDLELHIK